MSLDQQVAEAVAAGWKVIAQGRILIPYEEKHPKPSFSERAEGFPGAGSGERILDDDERWVLLRAAARGGDAA
jgi:hypothetical protein